MIETKEFSQILDNDETIVETFKPKKYRFLVFNIIIESFKSLFFIIFAIVAIVIYFYHPNNNIASLVLGIIFGGLGLIMLVLGIVTNVVRYNKTIYCYTNKRIIIKTGFIGADFKTLDYDIIGGMNVYVDFLDKLFHPNTGTIYFTYAAAHTMENSVRNYYRQRASAFAFYNIEDPYNVYKRIKEYSSMNKDGDFNS